MISFLKKAEIFQESFPALVRAHEQDQVLAFTRKGVLFVFNFNPAESFTGYGIPMPEGVYRIVLNTDNPEYGGHDRIDTHLTYPATGTGQTGTFVRLYLPSRTGLVLEPVTQ